MLNGYGVPVFHAKEFHDTKPPFKNWKRLKKRSFADELFATSHGQIYGLSTTINRKDFELAKKQQGGWDRMSAIGVCFSAIMTRIVTDPYIGIAVKTHGVSFLVESGNRNNAETTGALDERLHGRHDGGALRATGGSLSGKLAASTPGNSRSRRRKNRFDSTSSRPDSRAVTNDADLSGSNDPLTWSI